MSQVKLKLSMFRRWWFILVRKSSTAVKQGVGKYYRKDQIAGYYNDMTVKVGSRTKIDEYGVPLTQINDGKYVHFPIAIFQYGLGCFDLFLSDHSRKDILENFRKIANWALKHQREDGSWDSFSPIESKRYTVSSMCQGEGASLLLRASIVFHDERYKNAALNAVDFMLLPIQQGGTAIYENSNLYLEEYPQIPRCSVMNGWIFSLFGLYDAMVTAPEKYLDAFIRSYDTLCISIDQYDAGFWSYYDLNKHLASPAYHDLHIALLTVLNDLKNSSKFDKTIKKFNGYSRRPLYRIKAIIVKIIQKLTDETDAIIIN